jgi:CHASE3 domain sensor protein
MLTEDMTRLSNEIGGLRQKRTGMIQQLVDDTRQRHEAIAEFRSNASWNTRAVANALRDKRVTGLNHIRQEVSSARQSMKNDLAGVRKVWAGRS